MAKKTNWKINAEELDAVIHIALSDTFKPRLRDIYTPAAAVELCEIVTRRKRMQLNVRERNFDDSYDDIVELMNLWLNEYIAPAQYQKMMATLRKRRTRIRSLGAVRQADK